MHLCDNCKMKEGNFSFIKKVNGYVKEIHLCKECADKLNYSNFGFGVTLGDIMATIGEYTILDEIANKRCEKCGTRFSEIQTGYLGCSHCYEAFKPYIKEVLAANKLNAKHIGKAPKKENKAVPIAEQIANMKREIDELVKNQEYEKAAVLRDEIIKLSKEAIKNE